MDDDKVGRGLCDPMCGPRSDTSGGHTLRATQVDHELIEEAKCLLDKILSNEISAESIESSGCISEIQQHIDSWKLSMSSNRTFKLWEQYLEMTSILKRLRESERLQNWPLLLRTVSEMIPYLAASGHHLYTKSLIVFLMQMDDLKHNNPSIYRKLEEGNHAIKKQRGVWSGKASDLVVEEELMCALKSVGGLKHGRGWGESQQLWWILSRPACSEVSSAMRSLCSLEVAIQNVQHAVATPSMIKRTLKDTKTVTDFFSDFDPCDNDDRLRNIVTGVVAQPGVNVDNAVAVGEAILQGMFGMPVDNYVYKHNAKCVNMSKAMVKCTDGESINIEPQVLFNRVLLIQAREPDPDEDKKAAFLTELCPFPPALFTPSLNLRSGNKAELADEIWCQASKHDHFVMNATLPPNVTDGLPCAYVLDGGALLHRLQWPKGPLTYQTLCHRYAQYVCHKYGSGTVVVFDGYPPSATTKDDVHRQRAKTQKLMSAKIRVEPAGLVTVTKNRFIANKGNVSQFTALLSKGLEHLDCVVYQAEADADLMIVQKALQCLDNRDTVLVAEDTDLLALLLYHTPDHAQHKLVFCPSSGKPSKRAKRIWPINEAKTVL